jgi:hypothetical protein
MVVLLPAMMAITSLLFDKPKAEANIECGYVCYWNGSPQCFDPTVVRNCIGCWVPGNEPTC